MGRGNIYYITKDGNKDISFDESNYYDSLDTLHVDYVKNMGRNDSEVPLEWLQKTMQELGANISHEDKDSDFAFAFRFDSVESMKMEYFKPKLEEIKNAAKTLTLASIVNRAPALDWICNNDTMDVITLNEGAYTHELTFDDFIRKVEPGITYYVYNTVILMH